MSLVLTPFANPQNPPTFQGIRSFPQLASTEILTGNLTVTVVMARCVLPATCWLNSSDASRLIQYSVDGGATYQTPAYDFSSTGQIGFFLNGQVTHMQFTGINTDTFGII